MTTAQPNFTKLFYETFASGCHPIKYSIRNYANCLHDLAFMSSLVHDARVRDMPAVAENGTIQIPLNRDCWELGYTEHGNSSELHVADALLCFEGVKSINWQIAKKPEGETWIDFLWLDPAWRDRRRKHFAFYIVGEDWKCTITLSQDQWKIVLCDQEEPYLWSARNPRQ